MKNAVFLFVIISSCFISGTLFIGCINNNQEKLIESFVSKTDGIKSELNFKIIMLEEKKPITRADGIVFYITGIMPIESSWVGETIKTKGQNEEGVLINREYTESKIDTIIKSINKLLKINLDIIEINKELIEAAIKNDSDGDELNKDLIHAAKIWLADAKLEMNKKEVELKNLELAKKYFHFSTEDTILRAFNCTYSTIDPNLQNRQTHMKTFFFNNELTKIVGCQNN